MIHQLLAFGLNDPVQHKLIPLVAKTERPDFFLKYMAHGLSDWIDD